MKYLYRFQSTNKLFLKEIRSLAEEQKCIFCGNAKLTIFITCFGRYACWNCENSICKPNPGYMCKVITGNFCDSIYEWYITLTKAVNDEKIKEYVKNLNIDLHNFRSDNWSHLMNLIQDDINRYCLEYIID